MTVAGGPAGALVLHGFTGCPDSMRGLVRALAHSGFSVQLPRAELVQYEVVCFAREVSGAAT